jgi:two-component system cell cycle response regulator
MSGKILVVDDVATNRIILKAKLALACYDVVQAGSGAEALQRAREERPNLILLDLAMPRMDGLTVLRRLKEDPATAQIPVIVVTGHADTRSKIAALKAGAEDFLGKPLEDPVLFARVRALLRARTLADDLGLHAEAHRALGLSEAAARFDAAPRPAGDGARAAPGAADGATAAEGGLPAEGGRVALVAPDPATGTRWRRALDGRTGLAVETMDAACVLRLVRGLGRGAGPGLPDAFVIAADLRAPGEGLMLLSELRAQAATRHAAILVALPPERREIGPMALDLGASDLLPHPLDPEELALRLTAQLARKRADDALRARLRDGLELALTDPLTGLHNRRYALAQVERMHADCAARQVPLAAMMLDLDRFKAVNDRHGHAAGDAVLRIVGERLRAELGQGDVLARMGGEEFLVAVAGTEGAVALRLAERLRRAVADTPITLPPAPAARSGPAALERIAQTLSIGLAVTRPAEEADDADAPARLLARADRALYGAKAAGRNRTALDGPGGSATAAA